ncbi:helix-turn-helix domain-containing protein [Sphingomonas naphthae]|uniref:helix-turn-helix domain-containing protein n=1 Tax=Sphingomonas naphthae TaxID=1813468 RepID=UPI003B5BB14E
MPLTAMHICIIRFGMIDPLDPRTLRPSREAAGLTRKDLATLAGVNETTVLRIESGDVDPRLDGTWAPLVRALRTRPTPTKAEAA